MFGKDIPEVDQLKWLANQFGWISNPQDNADKICNAIHYYSITGAERIEKLYRENQKLKEKLKKENDDKYIDSSTVVRLKGHIPLEQIIKYIKENIDKYNCSDYGISEEPYDGDMSDIIEMYGTEKIPATYTALIYFNNNIGDRMDLFYIYSNFKSYDQEELNYYCKDGLEEMVKSEYTELIADYNYDSLEILKDIVSVFGGWIDEIVDDDIPFYFTEKQKSTM